jgi:hypothetical protein
MRAWAISDVENACATGKAERRGGRPTTMKASSWLPESIGAGVEVHADAVFGAEGD